MLNSFELLGGSQCTSELRSQSIEMPSLQTSDIRDKHNNRTTSSDSRATSGSNKYSSAKRQNSIRAEEGIKTRHQERTIETRERVKLEAVATREECQGKL